MKNRKNKKTDNVLSVLIVILIVATISLVSVWIFGRNDLDTSSNLVINLHNYFSTDDLNNCGGLFAYTENKVEYEDLNSENRLCLAYQKADKKNVETETLKVDKKKNKCTKDNMIFKKDADENECTITKIKKSIIDDAYKQIFGKDIEENETFRIDNLNVCYLNDDYYYCGLSETFVYTLGNDSTIYRVIKKAEEKSSNIIIYDYFIKINGKTCFKNYTTTTINKECTKAYSNKNDINYKFMKKYGSLYKHIFKKDKNDTYHWISSEPVK